MSEVKNTLEVGDKLAQCSHGHYYGDFIAIERVTATQAISGTKKFRRSCSGWIRLIGGASFSSTSYHLVTPEVEKRIEIQSQLRRLKSLLNSTRPENVPVEQRQSVIELLEKFKPHA